MIHLNVSQVALQVDMLRDPARIVPREKVTLFANAVVAGVRREGRRQGRHRRASRALHVRSGGRWPCKAGDGADA